MQSERTILPGNRFSFCVQVLGGDVHGHVSNHHGMREQLWFWSDDRHGYLQLISVLLPARILDAKDP